MAHDLHEFAQDIYDVLGLNTNNITQEEFFFRYVEEDETFMVDVEKDEVHILFDDFIVTIKRK